MNPPGDTLDIQPIAPTGVGFGVPQPAGDEVAAARARIAGIGETHSASAGQVLEPNQSVSLRSSNPAITQPLPVPVSPAADVAAPALPSKPAKAPRNRSLPSPMRPILSAVGSFIFLLIIFKSQIILSQLKYLTTKQPATTAVVASTDTSSVISATPSISIPKINVSAPVIFQPSIGEADILKSLEGGVVHYGTTVNPGQVGNMVIVGHSSNDWWEVGNYKFVFVLLDKLVVGDQFSIDYQGKRYVYQVSNTKVVQPTDLSVLAPTSTPTATLITCTPPGTSWKRLVIVANQVSPTPAAATAIVDRTKATDQPVQLPGNAPSLTNQLSQAWHNIVRGFSSLVGHSTSETTSTQQTPASNGATTNSGTLPGGL